METRRWGEFLPTWWSDEPSPPGRRTVRDRVVDTVLFVVPLGLTGLTVLATVVSHATTGWTPFDVGIGIAAASALWWRRRWPVGVAVGLLPALVVSPTAALPAMIAVFGVATHRTLGVALTVGAAGVVMAGVGNVLRPSPIAPVTLLVVIVLIAAVLTAGGQVLRARRLLVLSLRDRLDRAAVEQRVLVVQARSDERTRIAREMHDVLAHRMSLLSMHAGALAFRTDVPPAEVARSAEVIRDSAHRALVDLRQVIGVLRDDDESGAGGPQPTLADIPALIADARAAGDRIDTAPDLDTLVDTPDGTDPAVGRNAYRVLQEALTNARKHAPGECVHVTLDRAADAIVIDVRNRAVGRPSGIPGSGVGLIGLAERCRLAGGLLWHGRSGDEFALRARLPFAP